ncbi:ATP-grasp domain-containing protein [Streptococcus sp. ZJ151]|uniref:ATP-grasp domain-containing protein n=1 Tax=Streptococcus jiangjianxini TaxID=3161189 RepID=UPI0032EC6339
MNLLILSVGTRNKIVQYFKKELGNQGKVIVTDMSELAPAIYEADGYYLVPRIDAPDYMDRILEICQKEAIDVVLSLIDPELSLLAEHKEAFKEIGVTPVISEVDSVLQSFDKFAFNEFLKDHSFNAMACYKDLDQFKVDYNEGIIDFPVFVKPYNGSASININKVETFSELESLFQKFDNLMIQEFMNGKEYGIDCYIDMISGNLVSVFIKEKLKMRAGETDKAVSVINAEILKLVQQFIDMSSYRGVIDIDLFEVDGKFYISEVNPRFGGGYPHAYEAGVNIPQQILQNIKGETNQPVFENYDENLYMMKYNEIKLINSKDK